MTKTYQLTIDVPLPEGFERVEHRPPKAGEAYTHFADGASFTIADHDYEDSAFVLIPYPKIDDVLGPLVDGVLKPGTWVAMDKDGLWCLFPSEPHQRGDDWGLPRKWVAWSQVDSFINLPDPPDWPADRWKESLYQVRSK